MYSNLVEDVIPSELGKLSQLDVLDLSRNSLSGAIPSELANFTKLSVLVLSNLWDPLPEVSSLGGGYSLEKLAYTDDDYNFYEGTILTGITSISSLRMLWAPRAQIRGNFPVDWGLCNNLELLSLTRNFFSGKISERITNCKKLHFLDMSSNRQNGEIIDIIHVLCMTMFDSFVVEDLREYTIKISKLGAKLRGKPWEPPKPSDSGKSSVNYKLVAKVVLVGCVAVAWQLYSQ